MIVRSTLEWLALLRCMPRRAFAACALCAVSLAPVASADAQAVPELERNVKAAYLYKVLGYVEWPASMAGPPGAPINVGVMGSDDIASELGRIAAGRTVNGRPIAVSRLRAGDNPAGLHALYIGRADAARLDQIVHSAQSSSILTVTDFDGALDHGSIINFVRVGDNVRFEIAIDAAERSGLKLSSRLLAVAASVRGGPS